MKAAIVLTLILFLASLGGLMFSENIYAVLGTGVNADLARTIHQVFNTDGVIPVLQGLLILSGLGLAVMGVSYGGQPE